MCSHREKARLRKNNLHMKRVIVIGCPGSGKSTFAIRLHQATGLPLYHLDAIWHKPDKTYISRENFDLRLSEIMGSDEWIIDGNYSRTLEMRLRACDIVFLFDLPTEVCLDGAFKRLGVERSDMPWTERELDLTFQREIEKFRYDKLPKIYDSIEKYRQNKKIFIFRTRMESEMFLSKF